ncbi:MAG: hypothetical protein EOM87_07105, partial [Clostridia bacterium]|nr:hypothetical protein [Clostridia bacterium]
MKKIKYTIIISIFLCIILLVACQSSIQLAIPQNLAIISNVLEWSAVPDASGYEVSIDDELYITDNAYFPINVTETGSYILKVRSIGKGDFVSSAFSNEITYTKNPEVIQGLSRLPTPSITIINGEGVMQWRSITGAVGYRIIVNNITRYTVSGGAVISYQLDLTEPGNYSIQLQAIADSNCNLDSNKSYSYGYVINSDGTPKLPLLSKPLLQYNASSKTLEWSRNPLAIGYVVSVDGVDIAEPELSINGNIVTYALNLSEGDVEFAVKSRGDNIAYS